MGDSSVICERLTQIGIRRHRLQPCAQPGGPCYHWRMGDLGRMLVFIGGMLLVLGIVLILVGKVNLPIGRLPGDIVYRGKQSTFYFPLMTSILLSVILSLVLYFVNRMR